MLAVRAAPGSESAPGLRNASILWAGFDPGRKTLAASLTLDPAVASAALPLRIEAGGGRVTLRNATSTAVPGFDAEVETGPLRRYAEQLERAITSGRAPSARRCARHVDASCTADSHVRAAARLGDDRRATDRHAARRSPGDDRGPGADSAHGRACPAARAAAACVRRRRPCAAAPRHARTARRRARPAVRHVSRQPGSERKQRDDLPLPLGSAPGRSGHAAQCRRARTTTSSARCWLRLGLLAALAVGVVAWSRS